LSDSDELLSELEKSLGEFDLICEAKDSTCNGKVTHYGRHGSNCVIYWCEFHAEANENSKDFAVSTDQWLACKKCGKEFTPEEVEIRAL
jgi:hypothetical protein